MKENLRNVNPYPRRFIYIKATPDINYRFKIRMSTVFILGAA
jgi:hypothetical protein